MTDTHTPEVVEHGVAVLADESPTWDDGPFPVRGVAMPEDITTNHNKNDESVYWPPGVVQSMADEFDGVKITDPSEHDPETAIENPQPSPKTIVGEITDVQYRPGVGVLYEGEVDDPEIAKRIERDRVEVSPTIFRALGDRDDDREARIPDKVVGVRDLSVVEEGQAEGNSIEPATAAMSALSASALAAAFDDPTTTGAESPTESDGSGDDGPHGGSGQSTADRETTTNMSDEDTLTDEQRELLSAADALDEPTVQHGVGIVEREHVDVLEAAVGREEPAIVEQSDYETLQSDLEEAKGVFADVLSDRTGMSAETLSALPWDDLRGEFTDDDGELDAETLVQTPETGQPEGDESGVSPDDDAVAEVLQEYDADDVDKAVETLEERYERFDSQGWDSHAEQTKDDLETLGVEV